MNLADLQQGPAAKFETAYPLTIGREYIVHGMLIAERILKFLVQDDLGGPCSAPAGMFDSVSERLPAGWGFSLRPGIRLSSDAIGGDPVVAAWGYPEMIDDANHLYNLFERKSDDLAIFSARVRAAERALRSGGESGSIG